jgi:hypothetical protein
MDDMRAAMASHIAAVTGRAEDVAKRVKSVDISHLVTVRNLDSADTCSLCCNSMTDFAVEEGVVLPRGIRKHYVLPCGHKFHFHDEFCIPGTIRKWFTEHDTCPLCRKVVPAKQ